MKILSIGLALALPAIAGCGQASNQGSLPSIGTQTTQSAIGLGRVHPDNCNFLSQKTSSSGGFIRWKICNGYVGHMSYGPGSTGDLKIGTQASITNPGNVPVPAGETPVLFVQMQVLPQDPGPATFTAPTVPPPSNKSTITGVPPGTYKFYAYNSSNVLLVGPIILGAPVGSVLHFSSPPHSPLPILPTLPVGTTISFELTTP
jgi:hypothetical protein